MAAVAKKTKNETACKFDEKGNALPYYGNTVISFLNTEDYPIYLASKKVQDEMRKTEFSKQVAFVPADSFHMTILNLCRNIDRDDTNWPENISREARFPEIDRTLKAIVDQLPKPTGIMVEVDHCGPAHVVLKIANEEDERKIQEYRRKLADLTGIHHPWHDTFRFHITLNYILRPLNEQEQAEADEFCEKWTKWLKEQVKPFEMPVPQFVVFNDMMNYYPDLNMRGELY